MNDINKVISNFSINRTTYWVEPLGNGLINETFKVTPKGQNQPKYVLQRINHAVFQDVEMLQNNIVSITAHIREKLTNQGETDIDRKVLTVVPARDGKYYWFDGQSYWRMMQFIPDALTYEAVNPEYSYYAGKAFGNFQSMLSDMHGELGETIPNFHNMEFRIKQLREAIGKNAANRLAEVQDYVDEIEKRATEMCKSERLYREGKLPKRICHCDTKVNNIMFDKDGNALCVIDLDTVMPGFIFSDYGDFLRTAANAGDEDDQDLSRVHFDMETFQAFTKGYLESASSFLTPIEIENLPYAAALFPYMQAVRFLADYLNGDVYYKIKYPRHNFVRTKAQLKLLQSIEEHTGEMKAFIKSCLNKELSVKKLNVPAVRAADLSSVLNEHQVSYEPIHVVNWMTHPYSPQASFRMAYTDNAILINFKVKEGSIRARYVNDNDNVWTDACVEFFFSPDGNDHYYNLECNCIGTILLGGGAKGKKRTHASQEIMNQIDRWASLGRHPFEERIGETEWMVSLVIPFSAFFNHQITSLDGKTAKANFYKCGDELTTPHFLSWNPVWLEKPDFHCPEYFGKICFP